MSRRFLLRLRVLAGVALVLLALYAADGIHDGVARAARDAWAACVTLAVFLGWFGLEEVWHAGGRMQPAALGAILFVAELHNRMFTPSPRWSQVLVVSVAVVALLAARRSARTA